MTGKKKKKTVLYWKRIFRKAGVHVTNAERLKADQKEWKKRVEGRTDYLSKLECQKGKKYEWGANEERMERREEVRQNYERSCTGEETNRDERRKCGRCGKVT